MVGMFVWLTRNTSGSISDGWLIFADPRDKLEDSGTAKCEMGEGDDVPKKTKM
jgi:hypothetical protein